MNRRTVRIGNRYTGHVWWKIPCVLVLWLAIAVPLSAATAGYLVVRKYAVGLPSAPDLDGWDRASPRTSVMVSADGTVLAELPFRTGATVGHRLPVRFEEIPALMVDALRAAEDMRFFEHHGVDAIAVVRAAWANYRAGHVVEGASTITQQVARNLLPQSIGYERNLRRKIREALLARRIEDRYSKQDILAVYANHVFLGASAYGIAAAARAYFAKSLAELTVAETATIAGLAQAPGRADPYKDLEAARKRRDQVLARLHRAHLLDDEGYRMAHEAPLVLTPPPVLYGQIAPWHTERARQEVEEHMNESYQRGGLRIATSADVPLSIEAEFLAREHSSSLGKGRPNGAPQIGAVIADHHTGYVRSTIGGLSWAGSKFDRATQACRQPGSAFKPLVYAAALEHNTITAGTPLRDAPITEYDEELGEYWKPTNSNRHFRGVALAQEALALSLNAPAVNVLDRVGGAAVIDLARRMGITSELANVRPLALGASCVTALELSSAYSVFARGGSTAPLWFLLEVTRGEEVLLDRASPSDPWLTPARRLDRLVATVGVQEKPALDPQTAFLTSDMLADVIDHGTGVAARALARPAAGKTGTTNDNTDAWFVGYTAQTIAAVWTGHDNHGLSLGPRDDGSHAALPLWNRLVAVADADRPTGPIPGPPPDGLVQRHVDRETGFLAPEGASSGLDLYFKQGTEPEGVAQHVPASPVDLARSSQEF